MRYIYIICLFLIYTYVGLAQTAEFDVSYSDITHCVPVNCNFTDQSSGGLATSWKWYKNNIQFSSIQNSGTNFPQAGTYQIKLIVGFANGTSATIEKSIVIHPIPIAQFQLLNPADTAGCLPLQVKFQDMSTTATGTITKYDWNFGMPSGIDNTTNPTPSHTYSAATEYNASLIVYNNWGCKSTNLPEKKIKVYPAVKASFTVECISCSPAVFKFTNTTTGGQGLTYEWDMGNGNIITTTDIASLQFTDGTHTIKLTAKNKSNCLDTYSTTIIAGNPKGVIIAPDTVCINEYVTISSTGSTNVSAIGGYEWKIKNVSGQVVNIGGASSVNYQFNVAGEYDIVLITKNNNGKCTDTIQKKIIVKPVPSADFTVTKIENCEMPFNVQIINNTIGANLTYDWNFGDGTTSQSPNPLTHQYGSAVNNTPNYYNSYTIKLKVTDAATQCKNEISKTVYVRILKIDTIETSYAACPPATIHLKAVLHNLFNNDGVQQYSWNFDDPPPLGTWENTNTNENTHTYNQGGTYYVKLKVLTNNGCQSQIQIKKMVVAPGPCDDDGSGGGGGGGGGGFLFTKDCGNKYLVTFNDTVANTTVLEWDFDGTIVNTGSLNPIDHTFISTKKRFLVKIKRRNNITGDITDTEKYIVIIDEKANFKTDIINLCKGKIANFTTLGIDSSKVKKYTWDFGDSTTLEIIKNDFTLSGPYNNGNTSHAYLQNGVFDVKLIIEDKLGCIDSTIFSSIIVKGPVAGINANPLKICGDSLAVTFIDSSYQNGTTSIKKWIWDFGDNTPINNATTNASINHTYYNKTSYSEYKAILTIEDSIGCASTAEKIIKLYHPKANFYSDNKFMCNKYKINLYGYQSNAKEPALYIWEYGDGSTPDTLNSKYSYPTHTYLKDSLYTVKLKVVDENNCVDSLVIPDYIKIVKPKADFAFNANDTCECSPVSVTFRSKSKYATKHHWYINGIDAGTDTLAPYQFTAGYHNVTLAVEGVDGCVDTITKTIHIKGPIAKLNLFNTHGCVPFNLKMSVTGSNIEKYFWDFGDGNVIETALPFVEYKYTKSGKYSPNVILISPKPCVSSTSGCKLTLAFPEVIVDSLKSDFIIDPFPFNYCDTAKLQLTSTSAVPAFSSIVSTHWLFGDGATANGNPIPPHIYSAPGTYSIKMIDSSKYGCKDTAIKSITIGESPKIKIKGKDTICLSPISTLKFWPEFEKPSDTVTYQWSIDGNTISTDSLLVFNYRVPGLHELKLLVTTTKLCSTVAIRNIFIDSITAKFTVDTALFCGSGTVAFTNLSTSAFPLEKYNWNFGNGIISNTKDTSITYNQPNKYIVNLYATSQYGCKDTVVDTIKVFKNPQLVIKDTSLLCKPSLQLFESVILSPHDSIINYNWTVNGITAGDTKDLNRFFNAGEYAIRLTIKTDKGCVDTLEKNLKVDSLVTNFNVLTPNLCGPSDTAKFKNQSVAFSGIASYLWNYGDNTTATDSIHIYTNPPKAYDVSLIIKSNFGCADTIAKKAVIQHDKNLAVAIKGGKEICEKNSLLFTAINSLGDSIKTYQWVLNNKDTVSIKNNLSYHFVTAGTYKVTLYATSIHNCKGDSTIEVIVRPLPKPAVLKDSTICLGKSVQLVAHDGVHYSWLPPTGLTDAAIANPIASPIISTKYVVTVSNQFNCEAKDSVLIKVDKPVGIEAKEVPAICSGERVQLNAYGNTNKFKWIPASDLSDATIPNPFASPTVTTTYQVIGSSENTCPDDTAKVDVRVNELPKIDLSADTTIIMGVPIQLNAVVKNIIPISYFWTPASSLSCVTCPNPLFTGNQNSTYIITVKSEAGCIASDTINIYLFCEDGIFVPNAFTPNGDGLNDVFYPKSEGYGQVQSFSIFNRWGELLFEQKNFPLNDPRYGWDGTFKGNKIQGAQVFVYTIKVKCLSGKSYSYTGKVTIVQ